MVRYVQLNEYYILDTYTNKKLSQKDIIPLLNNYEEAICQSKKK